MWERLIWEGKYENYANEDSSTLPGEYEYLLTGHFYHVKIDRNLNVIEVKLFDFSLNYFDGNFMVFEFFAADEKEAVKIAKQEALNLIESGEWDALRKGEK